MIVRKCLKVCHAIAIVEKNGKYCHAMPDGSEMCHPSQAEAEAHIAKMGHTVKTNARHVHVKAQTATGQIRTAVFESREHVVVPVVMLVEGVISPVNAPTPELVLAEELARTPQGWNGRPILPDHPALLDNVISANDPRTLETQAFGRIFNAHMDGKKLVAEAWLDVPRAEANADARERLARVRAGEMVEVSVGVFVVAEQRTGVHEGQPYQVIWRELVPDHLAMLPSTSTGACSIEMGCGAPRAATGFQSVAKEETGKMNWRDKIKGFFRGSSDSDPVSDTDVRSLLDAELRRTEPGYLGVDSVFPEESTVIFAAAPENDIKLYKKKYKMADGVFSMGGDKEEVQPVTRFESLSGAGCGCGGKKDTPAEGEVDMDKKQRVAALIASGKTCFTALSAAALETLPDEELKKLEDHVAKPVEEPKIQAPEGFVMKKTGDVLTFEPVVKKETKPEPKTEEQFLAEAPESIQTIVQEHKVAAAKKRTELVAAMGKQDVYTEEELKALPIDRLEKLAKLVAAKGVDNSGRGLPRAAATEDEIIPPSPSMIARVRTARGLDKAV